MTINATGFILLALYIAVAKRQGADLTQIRGTIQNDILKEYAARGTYIYPPKASMRIITDIFEYCSKELPRWNTISISGYHIRGSRLYCRPRIGIYLSKWQSLSESCLRSRFRHQCFLPNDCPFSSMHTTIFLKKSPSFALQGECGQK